jgi:hypothetical protein
VLTSTQEVINILITDGDSKFVWETGYIVTMGRLGPHQHETHGREGWHSSRKPRPRWQWNRSRKPGSLRSCWPTLMASLRLMLGTPNLSQSWLPRLEYCSLFLRQSEELVLGIIDGM